MSGPLKFGFLSVVDSTLWDRIDFRAQMYVNESFRFFEDRTPGGAVCFEANRRAKPVFVRGDFQP